MKSSIISHDVVKASAKVRIEYKDIIVEQDVDLTKVIPGSMYVLEQMGIEFSKEHQLKAVDAFAANIQSLIDNGIIINLSEDKVATNPPVEEVPVSSKKKSKTKE